MTEQLPFHFSLSCMGGGNGNPLQCSCLENPKDGGTWWAAVYGVTQSWTRLKRLSSSSSMSIELAMQEGGYWAEVTFNSGHFNRSVMLTLCDPMDCSMPSFPVHHQLPEFTQTHVHWVGNAGRRILSWGDLGEELISDQRPKWNEGSIAYWEHSEYRVKVEIFLEYKRCRENALYVKEEKLRESRRRTLSSSLGCFGPTFIHFL